jgi:anhydro-N-acetylmuramic acid kinase
VEYGHFIGTMVHSFIKKNHLTVDFVSSHGHTIFHQPQNKFTSQIGDGAAISAVCELPVVCDFRSKDVASGGQGAPLVPIGDQLLFSEYDYCLNLGGIANITKNIRRRSRDGGDATPTASMNMSAFDVCPANMILNYLAGQKGKSFDSGGEMASQGKVNDALLEELNGLSYFLSEKSGPKSLGREYVENHYLPVINSGNSSVEDKLRTCCEHIAYRVSKEIDPVAYSNAGMPSLLITGGGAFNSFLVGRMKELCNAEISIPDHTIINFKEAMIFAFLGVLRWRGEVNGLKSVTGARHNTSGGSIYLADMR